MEFFAEELFAKLFIFGQVGDADYYAEVSGKAAILSFEKAKEALSRLKVVFV